MVTSRPRPRPEDGRVCGACGVDSYSVLPANCAALAVRESTAWYRVRASSTWRGSRVKGRGSRVEGRGSRVEVNRACWARRGVKL